MIANDDTTTCACGATFLHWQASDHQRQCPQTIADTFVRLLRAELSPAAFAEMQRRNRTAPAGVCASHDFCDANMVMLAAFEAHELVPDMDDPTLWNAAWERAMPALTTAGGIE
jgi:hypothetical protein